jgi:hypothetical protein
MEKTSLQFFISYSHSDIKLKEKLLVTLNSLKYQYNIDVWHDGKILAGKDINIDVKKICKLLMSFCYLLLQVF